MRIVIFTDVFPPKIDGLVKRLTGNVTALVEQGHTVMVVTSRGYDATYPGVHVVPVPAVRFWLDPYLRFGLAPTPQMWRAIRNFAPDVAHAMAPCFCGTAFMGIAVARLLRIPLVNSYQTHYARYVRSHPFWRPLTPAVWGLIRAVYNRADAVMTTSESVRQELVQHRVAGRDHAAAGDAVERVLVWRKVVCPVEFAPDHASYEMRQLLMGSHQRRHLLLYVGRLSREKRIDFLHQVLAAVPDSALAIVGEGPDRQRLEQVFLDEPVHFTGVMRGRRLAAAYASADAFVFPSTFETLGFVVLEALASGLPVVCADAAGVSSVVEHGVTGFLHRPDDAADAAARVRSLLEDPELRRAMSLKARQQAVALGSWDANAQDLLRIYAETIDRHQRRATAAA